GSDGQDAGGPVVVFAGGEGVAGEAKGGEHLHRERELRVGGVLDEGDAVVAEVELRRGEVFFFQAEDGIRDWSVTGVQTCALPILVRDRVIKEKTSLLVRDARLDQEFAARMSIVQQQIRSMLAVPLQTDDRVIGLI